MDQFEIKPAVINLNSILLLILLLIFLVCFVLPIYPTVQKLRSCTECDQTPVIIIYTVGIGMFVGILLASLYTRNRKIRVDKDLVYFMKKPLFKSWVIDSIIDFSKVALVKDRSEQHFVGKGVATYHWFIFLMKDGTKQELFINGYDYSGIKNLFFYVRGKHPEVKFDNFLFRDSSEILAGLELPKS